MLEFLAKQEKQVSDSELQEVFNQSEIILQTCDASNILPFSILSASYPRQLLDLNDPPPVIYMRGNSAILDKALAVIGTRQPSPKGHTIAGRVGKHFQEQGWSVCNGLAMGIDLDTVKPDDTYLPNTIGVLASGLDEDTLGSQQAIDLESVLRADGLIVSEYHPSLKSDTYKVIASCRLQSALSRGLILIQSSKSGGSRFALETAVKLKRPIGIIHPLVSEKDMEENEINRILVSTPDKVKGLKEALPNAKNIGSDQPLLIIKSREDYPNFQMLLENSN